MSQRLFRLVVCCVLAGLLSGGALPAPAQKAYRNLVNTRFRTVSNGPQSALIVDVKDPQDGAEVRRRVLQAAAARGSARATALAQELAFLRQRGVIRPGQPLDLVDAVIVRHNGRLQLPAGRRDRGRGPNDELTFNFVTTGEGAWNPQVAANLASLANLVYTELRDNVYGRPGWSGTVTVRNLDPRLGRTDEVLGALLVLNGASVEIYFPSFNAFETQFLAMAQVIAQAFHGPRRIAYDAWEIGMARAAAVAVATRLQPQIRQLGQSVNPANGFYFTPLYDVLNQPPLGNNTFTPPTKSDQPFNPTTLSGMLVPRLQMSATAWLKCYIENPDFFKLFHTGSADGRGAGGYYAAHIADPTVANDVNRLRQIAASALPSVEGVPFQQWYEQQYVLDTSVTIGPKIFAYAQPTFPTGQQGTDSGAAVFLVYYRTTPDGDEIDLSGTVNVIYWDFTFQNRLFLPSFETVTINNGFGSVAPFFNGIGGSPPNEDKMRVAMDFPVGKEYVRVYFPAGRTGTEAQPNDFSGVVVGASAGALQVQYEGGSATINAEVVQGAFGTIGPAGSVPNSFSRTRLTFTPAGGDPIEFRRNTAFNNTFDVAPLFVLYVPEQPGSFTHTFAPGLQMISLPFRPLGGNVNALVTALGLDPGNVLLAQYRQDLQGTDKYLRYPSLPLYQPGYALWSNFPTPRTITGVRGERTDNQSEISVPLQFGWTQIGTPYPVSTNILTDVTFQYLGGDILSYTDAVQRGWIAPGVIGYSPQAGYQDITTTENLSFPRNILEPWKGYWIRVLVTEGITMTFSNPATRASRARNGRTRGMTDPVDKPGGWRMPIFVRDAQGHVSSAVLGQSPRGADTYVPSLHVAVPPSITRAATLGVRFPHPGWDNGQGGAAESEFLTDIRRTGQRSTWDVKVTVPEPDREYTLGWSLAGGIPRGMRLTLIDTENGVRRVMNNSSSYTFRAGREALARRFQIIAEPRAAGRVRILNVSAVPTPATGGRAVPAVAISYELSDVADTVVEIRSGGRLVRRLNAGRAAQIGLNQTVWDTRDDQGRILPAGAYTVQVTARTPEGDQARVVVPLLLTR
ncbi:MAG: FlgD immunoglobulin-like domain containing protein [Chloroherpetonaceae bacterium]|nr:hypothetical protein [Chthonomonadaceae bacterium]MDW8208100.1 FlgD immunoglobulin-like domain containing protein [Chloroherpetonaceae bacterium]